jgi:hypothetical protein
LRWYAVAVLGPVALTTIGFGAWVVTGGAAPPAEALSQWTLLPVFFVYILLAAGAMPCRVSSNGSAPSSQA